MKIEDIINGAISPFDNYCDGYGAPGASGLGYISVLKLDTGKVKADMDKGLEAIVSYDRAETKGAYIGQINMVTASSFTGVNGAVWGYHIAKEESIKDGSIKPLFFQKRKDGKEIPIYSVDPLLNAGERLFGTKDKKRFPIIPGAHVNCAVKSSTATGPTYVWSAIALSIAEDREKTANLFVEDAGDFIDVKSDKDMDIYWDTLMKKIAKSIIRCADDSNVKYKEIFMGYRSEWIPEGYVGCALTCAPYITLAKKAIPSDKSLVSISISEWEESLKLN